MKLSAEISRLNNIISSENLHKESLKRQITDMQMQLSLTKDSNMVKFD
jgi:hypothetical protein